MSEGADSVAQTCGDSLTPLRNEGEQKHDATTATATPSPPSPPPPPPPPPPQPSTRNTGRRSRFGTGGIPPSPYVFVDGRQLRSALAWTKKWPPRRVSFPLNDNHLVTGYLEPANPWRHAENVNRADLIFAYKESCARHNTEPLQNVLVQLEKLDLSQDRCEELILKGEILNQDNSEPLEEILKRVQFNKINLEGTSLNDESSIILFDMLEYYESARHINISCNPQIGVRGWQACSHMIKKTQCLEQFEARDINFNEQNMSSMSRALRLVGHLHVLKLENCGLSGRAIVILVTALKMNNGIRELYLADNGLDLYDAIQLGSLLRMNNHLQLLDISNNNVQDDGVRDILDGLINQVNEDKTGKGLSILILWNNHLTKKSSPYFSRIIALSKTLETLNIGQNMLTDETLNIVNESLKNNPVLLQLGMQSTELTCEGIITLAEIMKTNQVLQRIDLRDNSIQLRGMQALMNVMKNNKTITQIDLDDKPRIRIDGPLHQYIELIAEIRSCCCKNEERHQEESAEDAESPQHPNRLLNASSRKISLTCQTLPSPPSRSATSLAADEPAGRAMLEPKRNSGGRLRSPAPSPIPSPVASPIPSPSRNRFVVCRVPEASLRSIDSSASSSPITPPSLGSSPCFFPSTSTPGGPSRFRVSVVESLGAGRSSPKSVVASSSGSSVTIGFNVTVHAADSNDSDNSTKADTATQAASGNTAASVDTFNIVAVARETSSSEDISKNEDHCEEGTKGEETRSGEHQDKMQSETDKIIIATCKDKRDQMTEVEEERLVQNDIIRTSQSERNENIAMKREYHDDETANQSNVKMDLESATMADRNTEVIRDHHIMYTSTKELQVPAYPNEDTASARISVVENKSLNSAIKSSLNDISESCVNQTSAELSTCVLESSVNNISETSSTRTTESHSQEHVEQASTSVQRHKSSLERLLSLFQHPGQFFSDSSSTATDTRSSLQENVSGVMALGDKLQQYLKEGRAKVSTDSSWSSEHESPSKNRSMKVNVSQLQNLTGIFASFKLEPHTSLVEHGSKFFGQAKNQGANTKEKNLEKSAEIEVAEVDEKNLFGQEKNQVAGNDKNLVGLKKENQMTRNDKNNLVDQEQNQIKKNDEKNLVIKEKSQLIRNDEDLFDQKKNQVMRNDEQKLFNQVIRNDEKNLVSQEKNQVLNDENNSIDRVNKQVVKTSERDLEDKEKKEIAKNTVENFEVQEKNQFFQDNVNLQSQGRNKVVNDEEHDLNDRKKISVRNSKDLEDQKENRIVRNGEKDSVNMQDALVNKKDGMCSVDKLQWTESDFSDRLLPESVQSKDDFIDNLVLDEGCVATSTVVSSSLVSKSTACIAVKLMDIDEYCALELSKADGTGCNDVARFDNLISEDENRNHAQDSKHNERLKRDDLQVPENNDMKCLESDDAVREANALTARKTCDTITTDSINQTSDSSFPICNIAHDRKAVDSISTVSMLMSATTDDDVGTIKSTPDSGKISVDDIGAPPTSLNNDANDHLKEEVTSSMRCVADQNRQCEFIRRKEEDLAEVLDDTCRDSAHCRSTSVNIKVESRESETTSPVSQESTERHCERQSFMPNNVNIHRINLKDAAEIEDHPKDAIDDGRQLDPTILVTPYETSTNLNKSKEKLIFCMTDISIEVMSEEDDLSPVVVSRSSSNDVVKMAESYFELPDRTTPTTMLLIENPEGMHRNSHDSGIEETVLPIDDSVGMVDVHPLPPPRGSFQESVDSGIESECSSICIRMESTIDRTLEAVTIPMRPSCDDNGARERDDGDVGDDNDEFGEFASDFLAKEARLVDNDSVSGGIAHSYLNSIKCAVVSTARSVAGMASSAPLSVVAVDEGVACPAAPVIAHSPAAVHGTSPK